MNKLVADIIDSSRESPKNREERLFLSTGSTLLNLACSDNPTKAFATGCIYNIIGSSSGGKSFVALSALAEACYNPEFKDYKLILDDAESACSFDMIGLFGVDGATRIKNDMVVPSNYLEDFHYKITTLLNEDTPFIYVLDSLDALTCDVEENKTQEILDARMKGKKISGSYGMSKPKLVSQILRQICSKLSASKSILIIISQVRDDVNPMTFSKQTRSGGRALRFYSSIVMWLAIKDKLHKTIDGKRFQIGVVSKVKIDKNKQTGKIRETPLTIRYDYGLDSIQDCVDYLVGYKVFKTSGVKIDGSILGIDPCRVSTLVNYIEANNLEEKLIGLVSKKYNEIENKLVNKGRKRKY